MLLDGTLQCNAESFSARPDLDAQEHRPEAQAIGEALGLCFMDKVFNTNEADWRRIPEGAEKTLDFVGSSGRLRLEVESKGSFVEDRMLKAATVSNHRGSILHKKDAHAVAPNAVRIGTIASLDRAPGGRPILWLLDPPVDINERSAEDIRLLNRMEFRARVIALISPRSPLAAALATRVLDLQNIRDLSQLDGVPLMAGPDSPLRFATGFGKIHSRFFGTKSVVDDGPAGGIAVRSGEQMFFAGVRQDWIDLAAEQDFSAIRRYGNVPATTGKTVRIALPRGTFDLYDLNRTWRSVRESGGYFRFPLEGDLHYSAGGLVFGWLPIPESLR